MIGNRKRLIAILAGMAVVLLGVVMMSAGSIYTSTSSSCGNCHEMNTRVVSWTRSTHAGIECMDCHAGVGWSGYVGAKLQGARRMFTHFLGNIGPITVHVEDAVCLECHFFSKDPNTQYDALSLQDPTLAPSRMHTRHFGDAESTCGTCHAGIVHGSLSGGIPIKIATCEECHRRKKILAPIELRGAGS